VKIEDVAKLSRTPLLTLNSKKGATNMFNNNSKIKIRAKQNVNMLNAQKRKAKTLNSRPARPSKLSSMNSKRMLKLPIEARKEIKKANFDAQKAKKHAQRLEERLRKLEKRKKERVRVVEKRTSKLVNQKEQSRTASPRMMAKRPVLRPQPTQTHQNTRTEEKTIDNNILSLERKINKIMEVLDNMNNTHDENIHETETIDSFIESHKKKYAYVYEPFAMETVVSEVCSSGQTFPNNGIENSLTHTKVPPTIELEVTTKNISADDLEPIETKIKAQEELIAKIAEENRQFHLKQEELERTQETINEIVQSKSSGFYVNEVVENIQKNQFEDLQPICNIISEQDGKISAMEMALEELKENVTKEREFYSIRTMERDFSPASIQAIQQDKKDDNFERVIDAIKNMENSNLQREKDKEIARLNELVKDMKTENYHKTSSYEIAKLHETIQELKETGKQGSQYSPQNTQRVSDAREVAKLQLIVKELQSLQNHQTQTKEISRDFDPHLKQAEESTKQNSSEITKLTSLAQEMREENQKQEFLNQEAKISHLTNLIKDMQVQSLLKEQSASHNAQITEMSNTIKDMQKNQTSFEKEKQDEKMNKILSLVKEMKNDAKKNEQYEQQTQLFPTFSEKLMDAMVGQARRTTPNETRTQGENKMEAIYQQQTTAQKGDLQADRIRDEISNMRELTVRNANDMSDIKAQLSALNAHNNAFTMGQILAKVDANSANQMTLAYLQNMQSMNSLQSSQPQPMQQAPSFMPFPQMTQPIMVQQPQPVAQQNPPQPFVVEKPVVVEKETQMPHIINIPSTPTPQQVPVMAGAPSPQVATTAEVSSPTATTVSTPTTAAPENPMQKMLADMAARLNEMNDKLSD